MNAPNLASKPFLNSRPVWIVTSVAVAIALLFAVVNLRTYLHTTNVLAEQLALKERLQAEHDSIEAAARRDVAALDGVPWGSLRGRIVQTNAVLREHGFSWLQLLDDIERVLPYDLRMIQISPSVEQAGVTLNMQFVARNRDAMLDLIDTMIADPRFEDPLPRVERTPEESQGGGYNVSMTATYHPPEEPVQ